MVCRAELEEKLERLQRIVGAMDSEARTPAAPGTVERAARGLATPGAPAARGHALHQAGAGSHRRQDCHPQKGHDQPGAPCAVPPAHEGLRQEVDQQMYW